MVEILAGAAFDLSVSFLDTMAGPRERPFFLPTLQIGTNGLTTQYVRSVLCIYREWTWPNVH